MNKSIFIAPLLIAFFLFSCKEKTPDKELKIENRTPVTITQIDTVPIRAYVDLNATSVFLVKNQIKAKATGYIQSINVSPESYVARGKLLLTIKSKEASILGNTINKIDSTLNFGKPIPVTATATGYLTSFNYQNGDYVQDGEPLAVINDLQSFAFVLDLPYEYRRFVEQKDEVTIYLPDGTVQAGIIDKFKSSVDAVSQTLGVIIKLKNKTYIPENLVAKVRIYKTAPDVASGISLPKAAVLANETETDFWVMKLINDSTAVKIPVIKGIETNEKVEILNPEFSLSDKIILTGNYGVADTLKVSVTNNYSKN